MGIHIMPPFYKVVMPKIVTVTFYPDADPEVTSVDGAVGRWLVHDLWDDIRNGVGNWARDAVATAEVAIESDLAADKWAWLSRIILLFDTSSLPNGAIIVEASLRVYVHNFSDTLGANPTFNVFTSNPASNTALVPADYSQLGNAPLATPIAFADIVGNAYNTFTLNAAGRALINKAGITKLGIREASYDALDIEPGWLWFKHIRFDINTADHPGGNPPELVVTYKI